MMQVQLVAMFEAHIISNRSEVPGYHRDIWGIDKQVRPMLNIDLQNEKTSFWHFIQYTPTLFSDS